MHDEKSVFLDCLAHDREVEIPLFENRLCLRLELRLEHHQHAFLALAEHHLVSRHGLFALWHGIKVESDAETALVSHLHRRAGEACRAHVLDRDHRIGGHQFETGFEQALFGEGIAHLNGRPLVLAVPVEFRRGHRGAPHAVASRLRAKIDDRHADTARGRVEDPVGVHDAGGKGVHEAVSVVAAVKPYLAAYRRHAKGIAVATDSLDDS